MYLLSIQGTLMEEARPQTFINSYATYLQKILEVTKTITKMTHPIYLINIHIIFSFERK